MQPAGPSQARRTRGGSGAGRPSLRLRGRPRPSETETPRLTQLSCDGPPEGPRRGQARTVPRAGTPRAPPGDSFSRTLLPVAMSTSGDQNEQLSAPFVPGHYKPSSAWRGHVRGLWLAGERTAAVRARREAQGRGLGSGLPRRRATPRAGLSWAAARGGKGRSTRFILTVCLSRGVRKVTTAHVDMWTSAGRPARLGGSSRAT